MNRHIPRLLRVVKRRAQRTLRDMLIERANQMHDNSGRAGCTYGDTEYDSESVVFGYNLALQYIISDLKQGIIESYIKKLKTEFAAERQEITDRIN